jgi:hypothetical protein
MTIAWISKRICTVQTVLRQQKGKDILDCGVRKIRAHKGGKKTAD